MRLDNLNVDEIVEAINGHSEELISIFRSILQFDTTNPPGNELPLAEYLHNIFSREHIDSEVIVSGDNRGNVIARLEGGIF